MSRGKKTYRPQCIKNLCISLLIVILNAICIGLLPCLSMYQDDVYNADRSKYDAEKSQWDSIQTINFKKAEDSVFNYWIAHNDTSLKTIKKISKQLTYGETGYYKKTGKWECEPPSTYSNKLVCEPMKEWVTTDYYVDGYYYDTTWTDGYNNRNEWLKKAHNIAHGEAIKHKVEFRPYDGHESHYIFHYNSTAHGLLVMLLMIGIIASFFTLAYLLMTLIFIIRGIKPDYSNFGKYAFGIMMAEIIGAVVYYAL